MVLGWYKLVKGNSRENRKDVLFYKSQPKKNFTWNYLIIYLIINSIINLSIIYLEKLTNPSLTYLKLIISFSVLVKNSERWSTCSYKRHQQRQALLTLNNRPLQISLHFSTQKRGLSKAFTVHLITPSVFSLLLCLN